MCLLRLRVPMPLEDLTFIPERKAESTQLGRLQSEGRPISDI